MLPKPNSASRESAMSDSIVQESIPRTDSALTRRGFLQAGLAVGGALVVAFQLPSAHGAQAGKSVFAPNAFIRIDAHGKVTLIMPQVEMGQGIYTAVAMILAEELDAAFDQVDRRVNALTHLDLRHDERDLAMGIDANEGIGREH